MKKQINEGYQPLNKGYKPSTPTTPAADPKVQGGYQPATSQVKPIAPPPKKM
jgi:hypothetical protein